MNDRFPLDSDAPIEDPERDRDRLGFRELARHLTNLFLRNDLSRGLVVGIEGEWGSGKSSLANLALNALEEEKEQHSLRVVHFSPWIVGNRDQLLGQLFAELDSVLYELLPIDSREQVRTALRAYVQGVASLASSLKIAGDLGIPMAASVGNALKSAASAVSQSENPSLSQLKEKLRNQLADHNGKIIVFIDDLDRLEPQETVEVLRLVRAVADFPKVAYLLAYDPSVLAKSLKTALGVKDGKAYIEKLVQVSFAIPEPMSFDLRSWLAEETMAIFDRADLTPEAAERLERALSCWCSEYISTPRDVVRTANALKLHIAPLAERLDPADGLFIQIIRLHHPELHDWVQRHLIKKFSSGLNDFRLGSKDVAENSDREQGLELAEIAGRQGRTQYQFLGDLRQHLPQASIPNGPWSLAFESKDGQQFAVERRLYSVSYFRLYFALSLPAGFLSDEEVWDFLDLCSRDPKAAACHFRDRCAEDRLQGGNMAQVLLSRILERKRDISADRVPDLLAVLGDSMDDFARRLPKRPGSPPSLYGDTLEVFRLIGYLSNDERLVTLEKLFADASSLAWLNAIVVEEIVEHGFAGFQDRPVEQRLLTGEEFMLIREKFLERLEHAGAKRLKETPFFLSLMYGWHWAGSGEQAVAWVRKQSSRDADFLVLLGYMKSKSLVSDGNETRENYYLARQTLKMFFGSLTAVTKRLTRIVSDTEQTDEIQAAAKTFDALVEPPDSRLQVLREKRDEYLREQRDK